MRMLFSPFIPSSPPGSKKLEMFFIGHVIALSCLSSQASVAYKARRQAPPIAGARPKRTLEAISSKPLIMYEAPPQHTCWYAIEKNGHEGRR
jgi:hypothetical protein